jgi:peroxiredoxin
MTIAIIKGQEIISGILYRINEDNVHSSIGVSELFADKRVVIFLGPAPFSRLDTEQANDYELLSIEMLKHGIDEIFGIYVQDAFVMNKFQEHIREQAGSANVKFYGDGDGFFVRANQLSHDFTSSGLSVRSGRWAMVLNNNTVEHVAVDDYTLIDLTSARSILKYLKNET